MGGVVFFSANSMAISQEIRERECSLSTYSGDWRAMAMISNYAPDPNTLHVIKTTILTHRPSNTDFRIVEIDTRPARMEIRVESTEFLIPEGAETYPVDDYTNGEFKVWASIEFVDSDMSANQIEGDAGIASDPYNEGSFIFEFPVPSIEEVQMALQAEHSAAIHLTYFVDGQRIYSEYSNSFETTGLWEAREVVSEAAEIKFAKIAGQSELCR